MSPIFRKLAGRIAVSVAFVIEGALILATAIGMSTTADDAQNLPRVVQWLMGTPWWVPGLVIPGVLLAFAAWVFRPDQVTLNAMNEYKASNDRAWEFQAGFAELVAKHDATVHKMDEMIAKVEEHRTEVRRAVMQLESHQQQHQFMQEGFRKQVETIAQEAFKREAQRVQDHIIPRMRDQDVTMLRTQLRLTQEEMERELKGIKGELSQLRSPQDTGSKTPR